MPVQWLFLDMNSFFASVEQQRNPDLRGRPVAVVPCLADTTCCIAVSYEAKAFDVKTGTNVAEAVRLCPHLRIVEAKHGPYRAYHDEILRVVGDCLPVSKVLSVDEFVCELWANERRLSDAIRLGEHVKSQIKTHVGECLHCSVGLGPNPFLSKVAAELQKPNGLVVLDDKDMPRKLFRMRLTDWPGINKRMEARFAVAGVFNTEQMYELSCDRMRRVWGGVVGERWWRQLRGLSVADLPSVRRSLGHSHVLPPVLRTEQGASAIAGRLLEKAAARLRHHGFHARGLSVHIRSLDGQSWSVKRRFAPVADTFFLLSVLRSLWEHPFPIPRQVGIVLFDLLPDSAVTLPLFETDARRLRAARAVDEVNGRWGKGTVTMASVLPVKAAAEDKIAFSRIGEWD